MTTQTPRDALPAEAGPVQPAGRRNLRAADWLYRSKAASVLWLVARLWLGYSWLNAGYQKLWGSEKAAFWNGGGAGVKGFATAGVAGGTYLFALPGSPGACRDAWDGILVHQLDNRFRPCTFVELMPRLMEK